MDMEYVLGMLLGCFALIAIPFVVYNFGWYYGPILALSSSTILMILLN